MNDSEQMPNRHRSHALDRETVNAFERKVLDAGWIFRETPNDDYGADGIVEIVDQRTPTGVTFPVQLKGTEQENDAAFRAIRLRMSTYNYLRVQAPALVVRFDANTDRLWARWLHTFDPYPRRIEPSAQSISIPISDDDLWGSETPASLQRDVLRFREVNSPSLVPPIRIAFAVDDDVVDAGFAMAAVVHEIEAVPSLMVVTDDAPVANIQLDTAMISATLGSPSFTVHQPIAAPDNPMMAAADIAVALAGALALAGHGAHAIRLLNHFAPRSSIVAHPDVMMLVTGTYVRWGALADLALVAVELHSMDEVGDMPKPIDVLTMTLGTLHGHLSPREKRLWARLYLVPMAANSSEGAASYNAGHQLFELGEYEDAHELYSEAAARDARYLDRDYFVQELAGICFETGRFEDAKAQYERLLAMRQNPHDLAVLADTLMALGQYGDARTLFLRYESAAGLPAAHWIAKRMAVEDIINRLSVASQNRDPARAQELLDCACARVGDSPDEEFIAEMRGVLDLDSLNAAARRNLALVASESEDELVYGLGCALALGYDISEAAMLGATWAAAGFSEPLAPFVGACYEKSRGKLGRYVDARLAELCAQLQLDVDMVLARIKEHVPATARPDPMFIARFADDDALGGYTSIEVPGLPS